MMIKVRHGFSILLLLLSCACTSLPTTRPLPPEVKLIDVDVTKFSFSKMELAFTLDILNPNDYHLPVNTLEFLASSGDQEIATGRSEQPVILAPNISTPVVVNVSARANRLLGKLLDSTVNNRPIDYSVAGFVKLDNWPARIPFNVDKTLSPDDL